MGRTILRILMVLVTTLMLTACQGHVGSGPLTLTPGVENYVAKRMADSSTAYVAVSADGRSAGSSYCAAGFSSQCGGNGAVVAINSCENYSGGKKCYIYAQGGKVIWDFNAPAPEGSRKANSRVALELAWVGTDRRERTTMSWNGTETLGQFEISNKTAGLEDCAGEVSRKEGATAGRWQVYCASGQSFTGDARFDADMVYGTGKAKDGKAVSLKVHRPT